MKDYLEAEGFSPKSPRQVIKNAFQFGLINNASLWLEALENRNLSAYTYDQETAELELEYMNEAFAKYTKLEKVMIFGSRAMGNYKRASDVDY